MAITQQLIKPITWRGFSPTFLTGTQGEFKARYNSELSLLHLRFRSFVFAGSLGFGEVGQLIKTANYYPPSVDNPYWGIAHCTGYPSLVNSTTDGRVPILVEYGIDCKIYLYPINKDVSDTDFSLSNYIFYGDVLIPLDW
jgi:hypothetical protein